MEIQPCTHPHPLKPCEKKPVDSCSGCERPLFGKVYGCTPCDFFLHKSCAELPPKIHQHPFHPQHPLTLLPRVPLDAMPVRFWCDACSKTCRSFIFRCQDCAFNLDLECALLKPTLKCQLHEHPLAFFKNLALDNKCKVCEADCNASVLRCVYCSVSFHIQCVVTLPQKVLLSCHSDPLILTDSLAEDNSDEFTCDACEQKGKPGHNLYYCAEEDCKFIAHVYCAVSEVLPTLFKEHDEDQTGDVDPVLAKLDREIRILFFESAKVAGKLAEVIKNLKELEDKRTKLYSN
ncbi:hypothetical protein F0562_015439 [Nyssa sinensis]|uniref:Phorbol-ester/DAG-type domain-containing protein n=1 Tax=Nyssa sinensis TaxID=561372 RepID=A0A5J4ZHE2_9ASTE|nr:hypothetical protein F0562_015439 [Nyssa sinensis]